MIEDKKVVTNRIQARLEDLERECRVAVRKQDERQWQLERYYREIQAMVEGVSTETEWWLKKHELLDEETAHLLRTDTTHQREVMEMSYRQESERLEQEHQAVMDDYQTHRKQLQTELEELKDG